MSPLGRRTWKKFVLRAIGLPTVPKLGLFGGAKSPPTRLAVNINVSYKKKIMNPKWPSISHNKTKKNLGYSMPFPISHKFLLLYYVFAIKTVQMEDITNGDHKYNCLFMTTTIRHSSKTETWWVKVIYPYPHPPPQRWNKGEGAPSPPFHLCGGGCGCT